MGECKKSSPIACYISTRSTSERASFRCSLAATRKGPEHLLLCGSSRPRSHSSSLPRCLAYFSFSLNLSIQQKAESRATPAVGKHRSFPMKRLVSRLLHPLP